MHQRPLHNGQLAAPVNYAQSAEDMAARESSCFLPAGGGRDPAGRLQGKRLPGGSELTVPV